MRAVCVQCACSVVCVWGVRTACMPVGTISSLSSVSTLSWSCASFCAAASRSTIARRTFSKQMTLSAQGSPPPHCTRCTLEICVEASSASIGSVTPKAALARRGVNRPVTQEQRSLMVGWTDCFRTSRTCQHGAKAGVRNGQAADAASRKITLACQPGRHERAEHAIDATDPAEWRPPQERRAIPPLLNGVDAAIGPCLHEKRAAHLEAPPPLASEVALMQEVLVLEPAATRLLTDGERRFHVLRPTVCRNPGGIGWRPGGLSLKRPSMPQAAPSFGQPRPISQLGRAGRTLAGLVSTAALAGTRLRGRETPR